MSEIPEDVMSLAEEFAGRIRSRDDAAQVIARAIIRERERCSLIASKFDQIGRHIAGLIREEVSGVYDLSPWLTAPLVRAALHTQEESNEPAHRVPQISDEPVAYISAKDFGQLIGNESGDYRMTVPADCQDTVWQIPLYSWPSEAAMKSNETAQRSIQSALSDFELIIERIDAGQSERARETAIQAAKEARRNWRIIASALSIPSEDDYQRAAEADFQNHIYQLGRDRDHD